MKKILLGALAATLVTSCASNSELSSPDDASLPADAASVPGESDAALNNDPFLNGGSTGADASALATTPTEAPAAPAAPPSEAPSAPPVVAEAPPVPVAPQDLPKPMVDGESTPAPEQSASSSESTPPATSPAGTTAEAAPPAPGADTPPPYTTSTTLDSSAQARSEEPSSVVNSGPETPVVTPRRSRREELREYQAKQESMAKEDDEIDQRANYAHEGGAWQLGLDYDLTGLQAPPANVTGTIRDTNNVGGALSLSYFPLRSIDTGRLGIGARLGAIFSSYDLGSGTTATTSKRKLAAYTYGLRATYEFDYWIAQMFVPFVFAGYDQVNFKDFNDTATATTVRGGKFGSVNYGAGLNFNLNRIEPGSASKSLVSTGIRKFYLSYTFQQRGGSDLTGSSHFLGLRFEY